MNNEIVTTVIDELTEKRIELVKNLATAEKTRNEMEGKMQSRYDTQKEDWAYTCSLIQSQLEWVDQLMKELNNIEDLPNRDAISIGSIVELQIDQDPPESFLIVEETGGVKFSNISTLSTKTFIGKTIIGSKSGDTILADVRNNKVPVKILRVI